MGILDTTANSIFRRNGSFTESLFGYESTLLTYLDNIFSDGNNHSDVLKYFYQQLYRDFAPDINGYTLVFFVPPDLSGYNANIRSSNANFNGNMLYDQIDKDSYMQTVGRIMTFAAIDFTPPQSQVRSENISTRSGSIPIASEVSETDNFSITFLDNIHLDIYMFHHIWVEYIREVLEGTIEPDSKYYRNSKSEFTSNVAGLSFKNTVGDVDTDFYGAIDYAASCYIVKYRPDMKSITYVAKCVGIFPQSLPNKELIGTRTSNEIVTLPFTYFCSGFREALYTEQNTGMWIFTELENYIKTYQSKSSSPLFGGFLGGVINNVIGPTTGMLKNLTGNAANLGKIVGNVQSATKTISSTISAISNGDYSSIFEINK